MEEEEVRTGRDTRIAGMRNHQHAKEQVIGSKRDAKKQGMKEDTVANPGKNQGKKRNQGGEDQSLTMKAQEETGTRPSKEGEVREVKL